MRFRKLRISLAVALAAVGGLWVGNTDLLAGDGDGRPLLLAHRGLAQTFDLAGVAADTCTAQRIHPPRHDYLENTLASMRAAFAAGADVVELDVQLTRDNQLAVFHDATLDCRTNGRGTVREHDLAELRRLDIGYGYTADGGATFPFRGRGVGLMPTVPEVLAAFGDRELLLHVKSGRPDDGEAVADLLAGLPAERRERLAVYGEDAPIAVVAKRLPDVRITSKQIMKRCLLRYEAVGWSSYVPDACRRIQLHLPESYGRWLWGWPNRFTERMREADTRVYLTVDGGEFSGGFDRPEDLDDLPENWTGGVWTNRIDLIAPHVR